MSKIVLKYYTTSEKPQICYFFVAIMFHFVRCFFVLGLCLLLNHSFRSLARLPNKIANLIFKIVGISLPLSSV
jgi:hypothetical protein